MWLSHGRVAIASLMDLTRDLLSDLVTNIMRALIRALISGVPGRGEGVL